jgi:uncharacterized protein (UPF0333 family)
MFRKLIKNKKAQNTAEYAILISLVVAGIIAMQTYAQRALQARVRDAAQFMATETSALGNTVQYEPYYLTTNYLVDRVESETQVLGTNQVTQRIDTTRNRDVGGFQEQSYDTAIVGIQNGL